MVKDSTCSATVFLLQVSFSVRNLICLQLAGYRLSICVFFSPRSKRQVIVMEKTWKSEVIREPLSYLRPNPFYMGIVRMLMEEQKVSTRNHGRRVD